MESPFPGKPNIRRYSILPARAMQDDRLRTGHYKVLACLGMYANSYGVCWPSQVAICKHTGYHRSTVSVMGRQLQKFGYLRRLQPKKYKKGQYRRSPLPTNRYQILWETENDPIPSLEQFWAPGPRFSKEGDVDDLEMELTLNGNKELGVEGEGSTFNQSKMLANAFKVAVERKTGVHRVIQASMEAAERLNKQGLTVEEIANMTTRCCEDWLKKGKSPPISLHQVAEWGAMYK